MRKLWVLAGLALASCNNGFGGSACDRMVGSWRAPGAFAARIEKASNNQYMLHFTQSTGTYPFLSQCVDGVLKTGSWAGDASYDSGTDQLFMQGYAFARQAS